MRACTIKPMAPLGSGPRPRGGVTSTAVLSRASALGLCLLAAFGMAQAAPWRLSTRGYGPIVAGTSLHDAERLMGTRLTAPEGHPLQPDCDHAYPTRGHEGTAFMVQHGRITHVLVSSPKVQTLSGVKVGDTVQTLKQKFGRRIDIVQHHYDDQSFYVFLWERGKRFGVKFETSGEIISAIYAGDRSIGLVEGCS